MVFQPQKPQGSMLGFGDILLSMLASLSPIFFTSIIALGYKKIFFPSFLHPISPQQEPKTGSCACHAEPAAAVGRGRQAPGQLPAAALLPVLILQPVPSAPSVAAVQLRTLAGRTRYLRESSGLSADHVDNFCKKTPTKQHPK